MKIEELTKLLTKAVSDGKGEWDVVLMPTARYARFTPLTLSEHIVWQYHVNIKRLVIQIYPMLQTGA